MTPEEQFKLYDQIGEAQVRYKLATLEWQGTEANLANAWLALRAASKAQATANRAQWIAIFAIIISFIAPVIGALMTHR